jgi:hypothetical protein
VKMLVEAWHDLPPGRCRGLGRSIGGRSIRGRPCSPAHHHYATTEGRLSWLGDRTPELRRADSPTALFRRRREGRA